MPLTAQRLKVFTDLINSKRLELLVSKDPLEKQLILMKIDALNQVISQLQPDHITS